MTHSIHQWPDGIMGQRHFVLSVNERAEEVWGLHKLAKIVISLENNGYPNVFPKRWLSQMYLLEKYL